LARLGRDRWAPKLLELRAQLSVLALQQRHAPALGHEVGRQAPQRGADLL